MRVPGLSHLIMHLHDVEYLFVHSLTEVTDRGH